MMSLVEDHTGVWSPVARHDCATASPHSHGASFPHSHMLRCIGRPVPFSAALISGYVERGSMPCVLHQSILTQSTPQLAQSAASCFQCPFEPGRLPTQVLVPAQV